MKRNNRLFLLSFFALILTQVSVAQFSNPHPCSLNGVMCNDIANNEGIIYSFTEDTFEYAAAGTSKPFWLAVGEVNSRTIDTTFVSPIAADILSGPGVLAQGSKAQNLSKYVYFNDWIFTEAGVYEVEFRISGILKDTVYFKVTEEVDLCAEVTKGCSNLTGDVVYPLAGNGGIIPVDAIFPISMGVLNSASGTLDTTFYNFGYLTQISGPGNMYGTFSMYGGPWLTFNDIRFDTEGVYKVELSAGGNYTPDTISVTVIAPNNVSEIRYSAVDVYPNPVNDQVSIALENGEVLESVYIYNYQGQLMSSFIGDQSTTFDVSNLASGVYFIEVKVQGTSSLKKGIIVKK